MVRLTNRIILKIKRAFGVSLKHYSHNLWRQCQPKYIVKIYDQLMILILSSETYNTRLKILKFLPIFQELLNNPIPILDPPIILNIPLKHSLFIIYS